MHVESFFKSRFIQYWMEAQIFPMNCFNTFILILGRQRLVAKLSRPMWLLTTHAKTAERPSSELTSTVVSSPSRRPLPPPPQPPSSHRCHRQPRSHPPTTHSASPVKFTTTPHPSNSHNSRPTVLNHSISSSNLPATARGSHLPQQLLLLLHLLNKISTKSSHSPKTFPTAAAALTVITTPKQLLQQQLRHQLLDLPAA